MTKEERANQSGDVEAIRVGIRQNAHLLIAQTVEIIARRVNPQRHGDVMHFLRGQDLTSVDFPGV